MSPEQIEGHELDARTDVFSFGVILFEMLSGRRPFEGDSRASLMAAIVGAEPPALSSLQPRTPAALERLILRCLAKDPDDRWQTARDLAAELRWIAEGGFGHGDRGAGPTRAASRRAALWGAVAAAVRDSRRGCGDGAVDVAQACRRRLSTGDIPQGRRVIGPIHARWSELRLQRELGGAALRRVPRSRGKPRCARSRVGRGAHLVDLASRRHGRAVRPAEHRKGVRRAHAGAHSHGWWRAPRRAHWGCGRRLDSWNRCARRDPRPGRRPSVDR